MNVTVVRSSDPRNVDLGTALVAAFAVEPSAVVCHHSDHHDADASLYAAFDAVEAYLKVWSGTPLLMHFRDHEPERALLAHPLSRRVTTWPSLAAAIAATRLPPMERLGLTLDPHPSAPMRARRLVDQALASWDPARPATDLKLVVTELVTNAVVHVKTAMTVTLTRHRWGPAIRVAVRDGSTALPVRHAQADRLAPGQRGLFIVGKLTSGWGGAPWTVARSSGPSSMSICDPRTHPDAAGVSRVAA